MPAYGNTNARTHGKRYTRIYTIYRSMLQRCTNENASNYSDYGGRGIDVCDRWFESFENFYSDMGEPTTPEHTLDRINCNGNYCTENCRWATKEEQQNNRNNTCFIEFNGERLSITQWARKLSIPMLTLYERLHRGWSVERALTTQRRRYGTS